MHIVLKCADFLWPIRDSDGKYDMQGIEGVKSVERSHFHPLLTTWLLSLQYLLALPSSQAAAAEKCEAKAISDLLDIRESLKEVAEPSTCSDMATPQGAIEDNAKALAMASLHLEQLQREMHGLRAIVKQVGNGSQHFSRLGLTQYNSAYLIVGVSNNTSPC